MFYLSASKFRSRIGLPIRAIAIVLIIGWLSPARTAIAADIAISVPLSGKFKELGKQFLKGAQIAHELMTNGKNPSLLIVDDGCDQELGKLAADEIAASEAKLAFGYLCNDPARQAAQTLSKAGISILVTGARSSRLTSERNLNEWKLFRASPDDNAGAEKAVEVFSKRWKDKKIAIIDDGSMSSRSFSDLFRAKMEEITGNEVLALSYRPNLDQQPTLVSNILSTQVTALFIAGEANDFTVIVQELKSKNSKAEIAGTEALQFVPLLKNDTPLVRNFFMIAPPDTEQQEKSKPIIKVLKSHSIDAEPAILAGYSAMELALKALGQNRAATLQNLQTKEFQTLMGPVRFDENGANIHNPYQLFIYQNKRFEAVSTN